MLEQEANRGSSALEPSAEEQKGGNQDIEEEAITTVRRRRLVKRTKPATESVAARASAGEDEPEAGEKPAQTDKV